MVGGAGYGMDEAQFGGVQGEAGCTAFVGAYVSFHIAVIHFLAADRVAELGEMNANLVRATGFQSTRNQRVTRKPFGCFDVSDRCFSGPRRLAAAAASVATITHQL